MFSYEKLEVYRKAFITNQVVYRLFKSNRSMATYAKNQLGRASLSIMLNIAEGSSKFSYRDRCNFFITARGSAFECSSIIRFLYEEGEIDQPLMEALYASYEEISKMLFVMIRNLKEK